MAFRLFAVLAFFATVVLWPINKSYRGFELGLGRGNNSNNRSSYMPDWMYTSPTQINLEDDYYGGLKKGGDGVPEDRSTELTFLWAYVVFTWLFACLTLYSINWETFRVIKFRQDYLGSQSTVTDRTFRLTGVPSDLQTEQGIKRLIENLEIGKVVSVTLCRDWKEIDDMMVRRDALLRSLETSWAKFLNGRRDGTKKRKKKNQANSNSNSQPHVDEEAGENGRLIDNGDSYQPHLIQGERPQVTVRYGPFKIRSKKVDAIDYYEEKLRRMDAKVGELRQKRFEPTDTALVTMDSVASCQMVIQARIDPRPGRLLTKPTPAPSDLVWRNTYARRGIRRLKSWAVTIFITILTLVWIFPTASLASLLSICTINRVLPSFAHWLTDHAIIHSLIQTGLPTLVVSLLNVAVPYLYDWLANRQGMISQGDVELSVISKNFFFTFFNTFFVFAVSTTGFDFWSVLQEFLKDTSKIPRAISEDVEQLSIFYTSFIILQGIGLMPFRLLEVGSVVLHPFYRMMSKTPRDYAELETPPTFQYGFYLPTALLVFNLCLIYSVLRWGFVILIFGTIYFLLGYFVFKYMVLYAMDQPQHATGGAWRIICYRIIIGILVFEVVMFGQIATLKAFIQSVCILPLIPFTVWYSYYFKRRFEPLTKYIALRAIETELDSSAVLDDQFDDEAGVPPSQGILRRGSTLDEHKEKGLTFVNPSLITP